MSAVPPLTLKTEGNPGGLPVEVFDSLRRACAANRAQCFLDLPTGPFYGFNRSGATVPTLVLHGEDDQIVPIDDSARLSARPLQQATLKTYPGYSHGMLTVNAEVLNAGLLAFVRA